MGHDMTSLVSEIVFFILFMKAKESKTFILLHSDQNWVYIRCNIARVIFVSKAVPFYEITNIEF